MHCVHHPLGLGFVYRRVRAAVDRLAGQVEGRGPQPPRAENSAIPLGRLVVAVSIPSFDHFGGPPSWSSRGVHAIGVQARKPPLGCMNTGARDTGIEPVDPLKSRERRLGRKMTARLAAPRPTREPWTTDASRRRRDSNKHLPQSDPTSPPRPNEGVVDPPGLVPKSSFIHRE